MFRVALFQTSFHAVYHVHGNYTFLAYIYNYERISEIRNISSDTLFHPYPSPASPTSSLSIFPRTLIFARHLALVLRQINCKHIFPSHYRRKKYRLLKAREGRKKSSGRPCARVARIRPSKK